jgi:hypothetical protein
MCRSQKDPLRPLNADEWKMLEQLSRSLTVPADQVIHAKEVLAVADGHTFTDAAKLVGRKSGDAVAHLISLCWLLAISVRQMRPLRTLSHVSCTLPIPQKSGRMRDAFTCAGYIGYPPGTLRVNSSVI